MRNLERCGVRWLGASLLLTLGLGLPACEQEDEGIGEAVEELGDEVEDAGDEIEDELDDAT